MIWNSSYKLTTTKRYCKLWEGQLSAYSAASVTITSVSLVFKLHITNSRFYIHFGVNFRHLLGSRDIFKRKADKNGVRENDLSLWSNRIEKYRPLANGNTDNIAGLWTLRESKSIGQASKCLVVAKNHAWRIISQNNLMYRAFIFS